MALEHSIDDFMRFCDCCGYNKIHNLIPPTKKRRVSGADRISNLPDDIISNILSRLPTKHAVRTCVLSRGWKNNWTFIQNICVDFRCDSFNKQGFRQTLEFNSFVDKMLDLTCNLRLRNFHLNCNKDTPGDHLSTCISAVLNRGVQNLIINNGKSNDCVVYLKDCTTLEELKLSLWACTLEVPGNNCFSKLKHLYLKSELGFKILSRQSHDTGQLLLNFPVLQVLKLEHFKILNVKSVEIRAPELIIFSAHYSEIRMPEYVIKIHGPKLQKFYTRGSYINIDLYAPLVHYIDLQRLCVKLDVLAPQVHTILQGVPGLTCLKLNHVVVQALMLRKRDLSRFDHLKQLEVDYYGAKPLLELLHSMPNLEYLNIVFSCYLSIEYSMLLPPCIVPHLKELKFMEFYGVRHQTDLIKLFLDNAKKLEKVFVFPADNYVINSEISCLLTKLASKTSARLKFVSGLTRGLLLKKARLSN